MSEKIGLFLFGASSSELGTGDGGGNGHVKTLGTWALMEIGDKQTMSDTLAYGLGDAVALVAHHNNAVFGKGLLVDIVAIEQGAVDGEVLWQLVE